MSILNTRIQIMGTYHNPVACLVYYAFRLFFVAVGALCGAGLVVSVFMAAYFSRVDWWATLRDFAIFAGTVTGFAALVVGATFVYNWAERNC